MPVVRKTSPLLTLAIVGRLSLLREQCGEIWMPSAVLDELRMEDNLPGAQAVREAVTAGWLRVEDVKDRPFAPVLQRELDRGEEGRRRSGAGLSDGQGLGGASGRRHPLLRP